MFHLLKRYIFDSKWQQNIIFTIYWCDEDEIRLYILDLYGAILLQRKSPLHGSAIAINKRHMLWG
jgi:hypothetical protein